MLLFHSGIVGLTAQKSYHTTDAAVSLHNTLGVDITGVRSTIRTQPGAMATSHLVTCEASFTASTAERTLVRIETKSETKRHEILGFQSLQQFQESYNSVVAM